VIKNDGHHYRAFNTKGEQVGLAFMALGYLLDHLNAKLTPAQKPEAAKQEVKNPANIPLDKKKKKK
jgi:hypothetical protein